MEFVSVGGKRLFLGETANGGFGSGDEEFYYPSALALVPGLGLAVREWGNCGRLQVFSTPHMLAMRAMSASRVGWMTATYRAVVNRHSHRGAKRRLLCRAVLE